MFGLLIKIVPLALASTLSPLILGLTTILLGQKEHPKRKVLALLVGSILAVAILTFLGFYLGTSFSGSRNYKYHSLVDLIFGAILIIFAVKTLISSPQKEKSRAETIQERSQLLRWFILGFIINITNLDAVILYLTQIREIYQTSIEIVSKIIINTISILFFLFPIIFPLAVASFAPKVANKIIDPVSLSMKKYGSYIVGFLFLIFGAYYLLKGLNFI